MKVTFLNERKTAPVTLHCFRIDVSRYTVRGYDERFGGDVIVAFEIDIDSHKGRQRFHLYPPLVPRRCVRQIMVVQSDDDTTPA